MLQLPTRRASTVTHTALVLSLVTLANAAETRYSASPRTSVSRTNVVLTRSDDVRNPTFDDQLYTRLDPTTGARETQQSYELLGLQPCGGDDPGCFVLRTPFPPTTSSTQSCSVQTPPVVTLDGANVANVTLHSFDGTKLKFHVDIRSALLNANVKPGDAPQLEARAKFVCPTNTLETVSLSATQTRTQDGRAAAWIFPYNFYLVEELALLCDSIEGLVEAVDNLEITMTGDDGSTEFLYNGFDDDLFALTPGRDDEGDFFSNAFQPISVAFDDISG